MIKFLNKFACGKPRLPMAGILARYFHIQMTSDHTTKKIILKAIKVYM